LRINNFKIKYFVENVTNPVKKLFKRDNVIGQKSNYRAAKQKTSIDH